MSQLTDKQQKQMDQLKVHAAKRGGLVGLIGALRLVAMIAAIMVVNHIFVKNDGFLVLMSFVSGIVGMKMVRTDMREEIAILNKKAQEIIENK